MIRGILAVLVLALASTASVVEAKPKFKGVPEGATTSKPNSGAARNSRRFKSAPAAAGGAGAAAVAVPGLPPRSEGATMPADWAGFFGRCLRSVADATPLEEEGLETVGDRTVDYDKPYTKQAWLDADQDFSIQYTIKATIANEPVRLCSLQTVRGRNRTAEAAQAIDAGFVAWAHDMIGRGLYKSVPQGQGPADAEEGSTYVLESIAGNARRCRIRVVFTRTAFGNTAGLQISVEEISNRGCREKPGDLGTI